MPDPRFYRRAGPFRLGDLAGACGAALAPGANAGVTITDVAAIDAAAPGEITYVADRQYVVALANSRASACVTTAEIARHVPATCAVIIATDPRAAFADIAVQFYPEQLPSGAEVAARIDPTAVVAPGAVIGPGVAVGKGSHIGSNTVIGRGVVVGADCRIAANCTLTHCHIGDRVLIHPGVQVGQDGFGFAPTAAGHKKIPQLGRVLIHDDVEIGANCCIDRGTAGDTVIGAGTKIDNLVQIGHNVVIGKQCIIVAQVGISGSCTIGDGVVLGGQVGLADHVRVGAGAQVGAKAGVMRDVAPGEIVLGSPARPIRQFWREIATLTRLTKRHKAP